MKVHQWIIVTATTLLLGACASNPVAKPSKAEPRLEDVVAAVHVAMRDLAASPELGVINQAADTAAKECGAEKEKAKNACAELRSTASAVACKCATGTPPSCMPAQPALCSAYLSVSQVECSLRMTQASGSTACSAAKSRGKFVFKGAQATFSATKSQEKGGEFKLFVIGISGKKSAENVQAVVMDLKPFPLENAAAESPLPKAIVDALVGRVNDALAVAVKRQFTFKPDDTAEPQTVPAQAWISGLTVSVGLTVKQSRGGKLEWELAPVSIGGSRENSTVGVSKVDFVYGIEE